jgi:hypothetical protein
MVAGTTRNLFIQIGGSASDLTIAAKAGKSALLELGDSADDVQATVRGAFEKLGGNVADQAKAMEDAYSRSFANIRATAQAALKAPTPKGAGVVLDLSASRQEADQAQASATFLRTLSDAQARLVESGAEASAGAKSLAVSLELQAIAAEKNALASAEAVLGLERLAAESGIAVKNLDDVAGGHTRIGVSGLIADHVVRSFADSIAAGQSPIRAFALELPRVTEALQLMSLGAEGGESTLAKFAGFMGGPWGLALTLGASLLAPLIGNLIESGHAADDARKAEQDYAKALESVGDGIDKANGKLVERNRLLTAIALQEKAPQIDQQEAAAKTFSGQAFTAAKAVANPQLYGDVSTQVGVAGLDSASLNNPGVQKAIDSANGDVVKLRDSLDQLARQATGPSKVALRALADEVNHLAGESVAASQKADQLRNSGNATSTALSGGSILTAESIRRAAADKAAMSPLDKARAHVQDLNSRIGDVGAEPYSPAQQAELKQLAKDYDAATAAVKRLEEAQKDASANRQIGRQINLGQAEDIVHSIGGTVTSAQRSTAQQQVLYNRYLAGTGSLAARPGTSLHETGQALDVAKTAGISLASLKKAFEDAGVHLTEALDEGNHYHVGFGPKGPSADTLARRQLSADDKEANQDGAFQSALKSALDGLAAAQAKQPQTPESEYANTSGKLQSDFVQEDAALEDKVAAGKLTAAQALQIEAILNQTDQLNDEAAKRKELATLLDQQIKAEDASIAAQVGLLQARLTGTDGRANQKAIAQQILDKNQQKERDDLGALISPGSTASDADKAAAVIRLQSLPDQQAAEQANLQRQYASPGQKYLQGLNATSIGDSLQQVGVDGVSKLGDELDGVISGTKSVSAAFHDMATSIISDLLKIGIQQEIIKPLANSLFGGNGGGFLGGLFGGGGVTNSQFAAIDSQAESGITGFLSGFHLAGGGRVSGPGSSRSDSIPAMLSNGEFVVSADAAAKHLPLLHAINDNRVSRFADGGSVGYVPSMPSLSSRDLGEMRSGGASSVVIHVQANDYFDAKVASITGGQIQAAAPHIAAGGATLAANNAARKRRRSLV